MAEPILTLSAVEVRAYIVQRLQEHASRRATPLPELTGELNLIESGVLDSLAFMELLSALELDYHVTIELADIDPAVFATVEGLVGLTVAAALNR